VARGQGADIFSVAAGSAEPRRVAATRFTEQAPAVSPDSRWIAYVSNESGRAEVYVRPIVGDGGRRQISSDGGLEPVWAHNGRELFYRTGDSLTAADVRLAPAFAVLGHRNLFDASLTASSVSHAAYDVLPDDERFVFVSASGENRQMVLVTSFFDELRGR